MKIVFVHAHLDDEVITTALTMAKFIEEGHDVTVVHFSRGEGGATYYPEQYPQFSEALGNKRFEEFTVAMKEIGIKNTIMLGPWHDSHPNPTMRIENCFLNEDFNIIVNCLYEVLDNIKPDLVITYDERGYSDHPDHIRVNQVTTKVIELIGESGNNVPEVWWTALPWDINAYDPKIPTDRVFMKKYEYSDIDIIIDGENFIDKKIKALMAYESQMKIFKEPFTNDAGTWVGYWIMVNGEHVKVPLYTKEYYTVRNKKNG